MSDFDRHAEEAVTLANQAGGTAGSRGYEKGGMRSRGNPAVMAVLTVGSVALFALTMAYLITQLLLRLLHL